MTYEGVLLLTGGLLLLSVVGSKFASKLGVPVLLIFLGIGMLLGSDGPGGIWFTDAALTQKIGVVALIFILFSGGADLDWPRAKPHLGPSMSLATVGVLVTAGVVGLLAHWTLGFGLLEGLLLGAVVASTDAAAVFAALTQSKLKLKESVRRTLEIESGCNDPMAIFLTIGLVSALSSGAQLGVESALTFIWQMALGGALGWGVGRVAVLTMRRLKLDFEGLYHGLSIAIVLIAYSLTALLGGNGFLAVYAAGIAFGNGEFRQKKGLRRFHEGLAWLSQIVMFIVLGLLVFPSQLPGVAWEGILVTVALMFLARPLAVALSLAPFRIPLREQSLMAWAGLRGAVPIVLATFPLLAGLPRAQEIFNIVFFVVIFSTVLQGTTIRWASARLGLLQAPDSARSASLDPTA